MKKTLLPYLVLGITITLAALLSSCNSSNIIDADIRMKIRSHQEGRISKSYRTFSGLERETFQVEKGQIISLNYEAIVENGSLIIELQNPNGEIIWREILGKSCRGTDELYIKYPGRYTILIQGREAGVDLDISWKID
jgi:hypothetical protein